MGRLTKLSRCRRLGSYVLFGALLLSASFLVHGVTLERPVVDAALMDELKQLYQTDDPDEVIDRLVAEAEASRLAGVARDLLGDSYAGSWFDAQHLQLVVGTTATAGNELLSRLGVRTVPMKRSLSALREMRSRTREDFEATGIWGGKVTSLHIDYPTNQVVISVEAGSEEVIQSSLGSGVHAESLRIETSPGRSVPVGWSVRGADEYTNDDFDSQVSWDFKCSVGFSVVGGYLTAGHCGDRTHQVSGFNGSIQGSFSHSDVGDGNDRARVSTNSNWTPIPWVNGYGDGLISVPAEWAALKEYVLYSTVCRYGQASNIGNCGTITESDVEEELAHGVTEVEYTVSGLKRTSACVKGGDSGGPFISPADAQAQGITISAIDQPCSADSTLYSDATFDPIAGPLSAFNAVMLTAHGANPPTIHGFTCPDPANSGSGVFFCEIDHFKAQGETTMLWTSGFGNPSSSSAFFGTCDQYDWVTVDLQVSNAYGSAQESAAFVCPTGPPP
jgi:streptogrisin C